MALSMADVIEIDAYSVGEYQPVFIIAEVGVNHNGDVELAKELIREAARCGADCVKFQTFKAERVVTKDAPKAHYQLKTTAADESQEAMLKKLEMGTGSYHEIMECCREHGVLFISTPYNVEDVDFLEELGVSAYKLASIHVVEPWFARYVANTGKPIILSTGMATLGEVDETVRAVRETGNEDLILLQCTTNYPSKLEDTNLRAMQTMAQAFDVTVGYSDHTKGDTACIVSIGLGAKVIEKHFTLDKSLPGPDQSTSAEPDEFSRLVKSIRDAEKVMGSSLKKPCEIEKKNSQGMRRSIVANCNIHKGDFITEHMLTFKRPATGLSPRCFEDVVGQKALKDIPADELIQWSHIAN
jgi:N-acetylneuraminate synthase/N,N'-diacetyllegionaminate synthase